MKIDQDTIRLLRANGQHTEAEALERKLVEERLNSSLRLVSNVKPTSVIVQPSPDKPRTPIALKADTTKVWGDTNTWLNRFITQDAAMLQVKEHVVKLASLHVSDTVLVTGPTGTGKELISRALHGDRGGSFIAINCAGLPETLVESELFGHSKNSFTGSSNKEDKVGLIEAANDGTLFLDEVGELSSSVQAKLLRALQERTIRRVGSNIEIPFNTRIVCATKQPLAQHVTQGNFRDDLYARLSVFELTLTGLSERMLDIPLIVPTLDVLGKFPRDFMWHVHHVPYNVRSVQSIVKRYTVLGILPA